MQHAISRVAHTRTQEKSRPKTERAIEKKQVVLTDRTGHHQTVQRRKRSCSPVACNMQSAELRIPEPKKKNTIDDWRSYGEETRCIHWLWKQDIINSPEELQLSCMQHTISRVAHIRAREKQDRRLEELRRRTTYQLGSWL